MKKHTLSIEVSGDPPVEFRIFTAGVVDTVKGQFVFDKKAAKRVLAEYKAHGIDLMIDYAHASLSAKNAIDPAESGKAAGWFNLELRNGELWAVNVRWTAPAAEALRNKEWRFMSPAFQTDDDGRISCLMNVAITNLPATRRLEPLVAASLSGGNAMDPSLIKQALEAIEKGDAKAALEILKGLVASAAGADSDDDGDADGSEDDGADGVAPAPDAEEEAVEEPKVVPADEQDGDGKDDEDEDGDDGKDGKAKKMERKAACAMLCRVTDSKNLVEALDRVGEFKAAFLTLERKTQELAKERAALESSKRKALCAELVQLGAEFPATIWADLKAKKLKARWLSMPIADLAAHVSEQRAARGGKKAPPRVQPPPGDADGGGETVVLDNGRTVTLSATEVKIAKSQGCELRDFAALKAVRDSRKVQ